MQSRTANRAIFSLNTVWNWRYLPLPRLSAGGFIFLSLLFHLLLALLISTESVPFVTAANPPVEVEWIEMAPITQKLVGEKDVEIAKGESLAAAPAPVRRVKPVKKTAPKIIEPVVTKSAPIVEAVAEANDSASALSASANVAAKRHGKAFGTPSGKGSANAGEGGKSKNQERAQVRAWMLQVRKLINKRALRDYPKASVRLAEQGRVSLRLFVDAAGKISTVSLKKSSGFSRLDEAALAAAKKLQNVPAPPAAFVRLGRSFSLPIAFVLK